MKRRFVTSSGLAPVPPPLGRGASGAAVWPLPAPPAAPRVVAAADLQAANRAAAAEMRGFGPVGGTRFLSRAARTLP